MIEWVSQKLNVGASAEGYEVAPLSEAFLAEKLKADQRLHVDTLPVGTYPCISVNILLYSEMSNG